MAEQIKFGDRLFLKGEKVLFDNGINDAIIESRNGTLVIKGNLTVEGTTTSVNTESTTIADPHMLLTGLSSSVDRAGIQVERIEEDAKFSWDETNDRWTTTGANLSVNLLTADTIIATTGITGDIIAEDSTIMIDVTGSGSVDLRSGNIDGTVIGATIPAQAYFTNINGDGTNITNVLTNYTTDDLAEGPSNLYFTDERVDDRISNLFDASYGITATYTDPANTFDISLDAINIGSGEQVLDTSDTDQVAFRTVKSGPNLDLIVSTDGDNIVVDTTVKINNLAFNTFTGTDSASIYTLPYTVSQDWQVLVYIDGVVQQPTNSYTVVGNTLTLPTPLASGSVMNVIKMASNTIASTVVDADRLNTFAGSYYLDYTNLTNKPGIAEDISELTDTTNLLSDIDLSAIDQHVLPATDSQYDLGSTTKQWNTIYGHTVEATYADLAERYASDTLYEPGTVLVFGGDEEVTTTTMLADTKVVGIVSSDPALKMNSAAGNNDTHPYIALKGRVPCKVIGEVNKGDLLVTADKPGYAKKSLGVPMIGTVIGKAIGSNETGEGTIEVFVSIM